MTLSPRSVLIATLALACSRRGPQDAALGATVLPAQAAPAPAAPPPATPETDPQCRVDGDCGPVSCCAEITRESCVPRAEAARRCEQVECPRPVPAGLRCACRAGRCAGVP